MNLEICLFRKEDPIFGIPEMAIRWVKKSEDSVLSLECDSGKISIQTEGVIENKIFRYVKEISIAPIIENLDEYIALDGAAYTLSIKNDSFSIDIGWHELLPKEWKGVQKLTDYLLEISNSENICNHQKTTRKDEIFDYIDSLPFENNSLEMVLSLAISLPMGLTHQKIAEWCSKFSQYCRDEFDAGRFTYNHDLKVAEEVAEDVDAQWELYLTNKYNEKELRTLDLTTVTLPQEWFQEWLVKLTSKKRSTRQNV